METIDKPRPLLVFGLLLAAAYVGYRVFTQYQAASWHPEGHPWLLLAHVGNMIALAALATRWAKPQWKKTAMVVALLSALIAFVLGRQVGG